MDWRSSWNTALGDNAVKRPGLTHERGWHPRRSDDKVNLQAKQETVDSKLKVSDVDTSVTL